MKNVRITQMGLAFVLLYFSCNALTGTVAPAADSGTIWQAGVDGPQIEWEADGTVRRIYSVYYQPVNFPDRRGIRTAQTIAEEKAKADIVRFMSQTVSSEKSVAEMNDELESAMRMQSNNTDSLTKSSARKMVQSLREVTRSYASGSLRGVIILEQGYDEKREEAWVKVGISKKSMSAANSMKEATQSSDESQSGNHSKRPDRQPSEVKKVTDEDW